MKKILFLIPFFLFTLCGPSDEEIALQKQCDFLWNEILQINTMKHYRSAKPYERFIRKSWTYPKEILTALFYRSPKKILDHVYEKHMKSYKKKLGAILVLLPVSDFVLISDL